MNLRQRRERISKWVVMLIDRFVVRDFRWDEEGIRRERREFLEAGASEKELSVHIFLNVIRQLY
jgi:hypothetical protein